MEEILDRIKISAGDVLKFIIAVVIPLTAWFFIIKSELHMNSVAIAEVQKEAAKLELKQDVLNIKILDKLESIGEDVATIKGRLEGR
jgi:hypothetical protein